MAPLLVIEDPDINNDSLKRVTASAGFELLSVPDVAAAMEQLARKNGAMVLTGLAPPVESPNALELIRERNPLTPVILISDNDPTNPTLRAALRKGIDGCLPRSSISTDLARTVHFLSNTRKSSERGQCYTLENSPDLIALVIENVRELIQEWQFPDTIEPIRVSVALSEAMDNAMNHGNLELDSSLRQGDGSGWRSEVQRRRNIQPYCDRRVRFDARFGREGASFTISDEGQGFDPLTLRNCTEPENLELCSGRGLMLMHTYMDRVSFNTAGNEVTLVKQRPQHR